MWPLWVKIPNEDITGAILAINDTFVDNVRGGDGGGVHVDKVAGLVVKIPHEDYWYDWRLIILMEIILKLVMGVVDMEVDKVADMLMKIPDEGFTDLNLTIDDT